MGGYCGDMGRYLGGVLVGYLRCEGVFGVLGELGCGLVSLGQIINSRLLLIKLAAIWPLIGGRGFFRCL